VIASYAPMRLFGAEGRVFNVGRGAIFFLTETGNVLDNPSVVYRDSLDDRYYRDGYDPFLVY
jgi:hypothetical protein